MSGSTYNAHCQQLTYAGFCALGGVAGGKCFTRDVYLGQHFMHTEYYLIPQ